MLFPRDALSFHHQFRNPVNRKTACVYGVFHRFKTRKRLQAHVQPVHRFSAPLSSDSPSHLQFCNICAYRKKLPVQTTDWQLRMSPNLWFFFSMATISSKFSLAGPLHPGCAAFHSSLPFENLHSGALILHQFGGLIKFGKVSTLRGHPG